MWKLVGKTFKWVAGAAIVAGAVKVGEKAADKNLDKDNPLREALDFMGDKVDDVADATGAAGLVNATTKGVAAGIGAGEKGLEIAMGLIEKLEKFLEKILEKFFPDMVSSKKEEQEAPSTATVKAMDRFKNFARWDDPNGKEYQQINKLAWDEGFRDFGRENALKEASWAANMGVKNSEELHFLMDQATTAGAGADIDKYIQSHIEEGKFKDAHELAVNMRYKAPVVGANPAAALPIATNAVQPATVLGGSNPSANTTALPAAHNGAVQNQNPEAMARRDYNQFMVMKTNIDLPAGAVLDDKKPAAVRHSVDPRTGVVTLRQTNTYRLDHAKLKLENATAFAPDGSVVYHQEKINGKEVARANAGTPPEAESKIKKMGHGIARVFQPQVGGITFGGQ